jgi:hypothetical protein
MGLFGSILKGAMDVVTTPIAVVKDAVTLGGALTDEDKPYTQQKLEQLEEDWDEVKDNVSDL